jgi:hypothetical protein
MAAYSETSDERAGSSYNFAICGFKPHDSGRADPALPKLLCCGTAPCVFVGSYLAASKSYLAKHDARVIR